MSARPVNDLEQELAAEIPALRRFATTLTRHTANADDLVQTTLEKAIVAWARRDEDRDIRTWLFSILYRQFVDNQRRSSRHRRLLQWFLPSDEPATGSLEQQYEVRSALGVFDRLPESQRTVLLLIAVEGMRYKEVGAALGIPVGTVMSRVSRARQTYRQLMEKPQRARHLKVMK
ncbi:RNA polymerase sigma factor [Microbulbifer hainanensis]|uniref:RNA polymerase sigma factor n=1 Tax=Microbulbifer hainanensis TaxID=2735675 RepID=UPI001D004A5C|nr:sigma-70 family RNA polymerase sigma factor [Microbulbifer hainanensis]